MKGKELTRTFIYDDFKMKKPFGPHGFVQTYFSVAWVKAFNFAYCEISVLFYRGDNTNYSFGYSHRYGIFS